MSKIISAKKYCKKVFDGTHDTPKPTENGTVSTKLCKLKFS